MQSAFLLPAVHWKPKQILVTDMQRPILLLIIILLLILCLCARGGLEESSRPTAGASSPERIVSLAPSITETLFAVGLGAKVVGVTQFCAYPPSADLKVEAKPVLSVEALASDNALAEHDAAVEAWGERGWAAVGRICRWAEDTGARLPFRCQRPPPDS